MSERVREPGQCDRREPIVGILSRIRLVALPVAISREAMQSLIGDRVIENLH